MVGERDVSAFRFWWLGKAWRIGPEGLVEAGGAVRQGRRARAHPLQARPLDAEERRIIELHPLVGERTCSPLKSFREVLPIIRHHHERMDGTGYPDHLRGEEIPLTARILQTVDVFDALTTDRPYRKALLGPGRWK